MKANFFILLTVLTLAACSDKDKVIKPAAAFTRTAQADDIKPVSRLHHRIQLEPVTTEKFSLHNAGSASHFP